MQAKLFRLFIYSAAILLFVTAIAKLISGFGHDRVLDNRDPLFRVSYKYIFWVVGMLELGTALTCLCFRNNMLRVGLVAWLATCFLLYRVAMPLVGYKAPCHCLGNLTGIIHISSQAADIAMKVILTYLLLGSYATLFWLWRQERKATLVSPSAETAAGTAA